MKLPRALAPGPYAPPKGEAETRYKDAVKQGAPHCLREYLADWIADDFKAAYERQVLKKWKPAVRTVVTRFARALTKHQQILRGAEAKEQYKYELAMLALAFATSGMMRWVGASIQYKASRKLLDAASSIGSHRSTSVSTIPIRIAESGAR